MATVQIERDAAHEAAERELSKPIYPKPSLWDRFSEWLDEFIFRLGRMGAELPGGWLTLALMVTLLAVGIFVAIRIARNTIRTRRAADDELFGSTEFSAAEHRATAQRYAAESKWAIAIRHRLRAVARQLEEDAVLQPMPGRTANELAREAGRALPDLSSELSDAATCFNDVTYGEQPGTASAYDRVADLDERLRSHRAGTQSVDSPSGDLNRWAELQ